MSDDIGRRSWYGNGGFVLGIIGIEKILSEPSRPAGTGGTIKSLAVSAAATLRKLLTARGSGVSDNDGLDVVAFHLTSDCRHDCPHCWGPKDFRSPVDTATALRIVCRVADQGARRILFTGGDPLCRADIRLLVVYAHDLGLKVSVATAGDELSRELLASVGPGLGHVLLPLDGSCEAVNCRTRRRGHFADVLRALSDLREYPGIELTICTAVTRHNIEDVPRIVRLVEEYAETTTADVSHEVYQAYPRAMFSAPWGELVVSDEEFASLRDRGGTGRSGVVEYFDHRALAGARVLIFPDGRLVIPRGRRYYTYGRFLEIDDLGECLERGRSGAQQDVHQAGIGAGGRRH